MEQSPEQTLDQRLDQILAFYKTINDSTIDADHPILLTTTNQKDDTFMSATLRNNCSYLSKKIEPKYKIYSSKGMYEEQLYACATCYGSGCSDCNRYTPDEVVRVTRDEHGIKCYSEHMKNKNY